jgi:hypothetical protein
MTRTATALLIAAIAFFLSIHVHAATVLDLRTTDPSTNESIYTTGYQTPADGGGGLFWWDHNCTASDDGAMVIVSSAANIPGCWRRVIENDRYNVKFFGARGNGSTDDTGAFQKALTTIEGLSSNTADGAHLFVPRGVYILSDTLIVRRSVRLGGALSTSPWAPGAVLQWVTPSINGIFLKNPSTAADLYRADGTIIENLALLSVHPTPPAGLSDETMFDGQLGPGHAIVNRAPGVRIRNIIIGYWKYDALNFTSLNSNLENTNGARVDDVVCFYLGRHCVFTAGYNSSGGVFTHITGTSSLAGYTVFERSFLGNTYIAVLSEGAQHSFFTHGPVNQSTFVGSYQEASDPARYEAMSTVVVGGIMTGHTGNPLIVGFYDGKHGFQGGSVYSQFRPNVRNYVRTTALQPNSFAVDSISHVTDSTVNYDLTNGYATAILQDPAQIRPGSTFTVRVTQGIYTLWLVTLGGKQIEDSTVQFLDAGDSITVQSDGVKYWIIGRN